MKTGPALIAILILVPALSGRALADAQDGFGLFLGAGKITYTDSDTGEDFAQSAVGGGLDYQFALGGSFSVSAFLAEFGGEASFSTLPDISYIKFDTLGLQARLWMGSLFIGIHAGQYIAVTTEEDFTATISDGVGGQGFVIGVESDGGWFLAARTDSVRGLEFEDGIDLDVESRLLLIGFRWK